MSSGTFALYDLRWKCRSCLRRSEKLISLDKPYNDFAAGKSEFVDPQITIRTLITSCANVQVEPDDGLPQKVCIKCVLSIRAAFSYRRMCEQSDTELRTILQKHLSSASVRLLRLDERNNSSSGNCCTESIEIDSDEPPEPDIVVAPIVEITLDAALSPASNTVVHNNESNKEDTSVEVVELPMTVVQSEVSSPHFFDDGATQDELKKNHDSGDSFERYEMWENKQKEKRKKLMAKKIRMIKASKFSGKPKEKSTQKYMCEICSKWVSNMKVHSLVHTSEKNFECDICKRRFKMKGGLTEHMQMHIYGEGNDHYRYLCPICGNKYRTSNILKDHMRLHSDEKPFKCEHCGKAFRTKVKLKSHHRSHMTIKPHICSVCGKGFSFKNNWRYHMMMHAGDRPHKCDICGAAFPRSSTLKIHIRGHSGAVPYECNVCGEHFRENRKLSKHQQTCGEPKTG